MFVAFVTSSCDTKRLDLLILFPRKLRNLRQYATIRHILFKFEHLFMTSTNVLNATVATTTVLFNSSILVSASLSLVINQWSSECLKKSGPCHHNKDSINSRGVTPRYNKFAGFSADGTWRQLVWFVNFCISPTRFATNACHLREHEEIHVNVMAESDYNTILLELRSIDNHNFSTNWTNNNAAHSFKRGSETAKVQRCNSTLWA